MFDFVFVSPMKIISYLFIHLLSGGKGRQRRRADAYICAQSLFFFFYTTPVHDRFVLVHFSFAIESSLRQEREKDRIARNLEDDAVHRTFRIKAASRHL